MTNWTIRGADRESGEDRVLEVQAANSDEARRLGEAAGLLIEAVDPEPMVEQSMVPASLNYHRNAPSRRHGRRFPVTSRCSSSRESLRFSRWWDMAWLVSSLSSASF
jgi:hypothetical protein